MNRCVGWLLVALVVVGCRALPRPTPASPLPLTGSVDELAAAIAAAAKRSDRESDSKVRGELAAQASSAADACIAREPQAAACLYGRAVALGLEARAHPTRAGELLKAMLGCLSDAEAADPGYDHAGPARVRALVLVRAPGWPLGPGDPESGLASARRAAALQPQYPPNLLALAEALAKTGDSSGARTGYAHARAVAETQFPSAERDEWMGEAGAALQRLDAQP